MRVMKHHTAVVFTALVALVACDNPSSPASAPNLSGAWLWEAHAAAELGGNSLVCDIDGEIVAEGTEASFSIRGSGMFAWDRTGSTGGTEPIDVHWWGSRGSIDSALVLIDGVRPPDEYPRFWMDSIDTWVMLGHWLCDDMTQVVVYTDSTVINKDTARGTWTLERIQP